MELLILTLLEEENLNCTDVFLLELCIILEKRMYVQVLIVLILHIVLN